MKKQDFAIKRMYPASRPRGRPESAGFYVGTFGPSVRGEAFGLDTIRIDDYRIAMQKVPDGVPLYVTGEYRLVDFPTRLVFTWTWEDAVENVRDTVVTVDFLEAGYGTEIVLMHELLPEERRASHTGGWTSILEKLGFWESSLQASSIERK